MTENHNLNVTSEKSDDDEKTVKWSDIVTRKNGKNQNEHVTKQTKLPHTNLLNVNIETRLFDEQMLIM